MYLSQTFSIVSDFIYENASQVGVKIPLLADFSFLEGQRISLLQPNNGVVL